MNSVLTKSTTNAPVSASKHPILGTADFSTPERAGVGVASPAPDGVIPVIHLWTYFSQYGYRSIAVAVVERPDATILTATLPCGYPVRLWDYGRRGVGIQVKSKHTADRWYEVLPHRCQCPRWHFQHHCDHMDATGEAMEVYERWQRYSDHAAQEGQAA